MTSNILLQSLKDILSFPNWGKGVWFVWLRNYHYFKATIMISVFWIVLEPLLYLFAIGYGLGHYVGGVGNLTYAEYFAPALMATSGMLVSFFEATYASYTKLTRQKTFNTILLAPISSSEIALGEIAWATSKGLLSSFAVAVVSYVLGIIEFSNVLPALLVMSLICWIFSSFGLLMAGFARNYDWFVYAQSGFIIPMSLFSGTYFPLSRLPDFMQGLAYFLPLTHGVMAIRMLLVGQLHSIFFINLAVLLSMAVFLSNWAVAKLNRRLVY